MIIIIDNYDSFVFNLARYVEELGHKYVVLRNDKFTCEQIAEINPSHIILSPGPGKPRDAGNMIELILEFNSTVPMLGVCLGHQAIAEAFGGGICKSIRPMHGKSSYVKHNARGIFADISSPVVVGRYHSLIVNDKLFPDCLEITALSDEQEIMAFSHKNLPIHGVQFHPESILTICGKQICYNFLK